MKYVLWLVLTLVVAAGAAVGVTYEFTRHYAAFGTETYVDFPKGTGSMEMAQQLAKAGVIAHPGEFLALHYLHPGRALKAGEYHFSQPATVVEVWDRIARGDLFYYTLTVREGENIFDIAGAAAKLKLFSASDFLTAAHDNSLIRDLDPQAPTLEGYLFPSTYHVGRHTTPGQLCLMMTTRFREVWKSLGAPAHAHQIVTLASLIEREARQPSDRPLISSVFHNRMNVGMKLDCDPTTIYAALLDGRYQGTIHQSDLSNDNPYNTYRHAGLPPGPIDNPGKESILAAIHPAETDYLYFVLRPDGSGAHNFSRTIDQHLTATAQYRRASQPKPVEKSAPARVSHRKKSRRSQ